MNERLDLVADVLRIVCWAVWGLAAIVFIWAQICFVIYVDRAEQAERDDVVLMVRA